MPFVKETIYNPDGTVKYHAGAGISDEEAAELEANGLKPEETSEAGEAAPIYVKRTATAFHKGLSPALKAARKAATKEAETAAKADSDAAPSTGRQADAAVANDTPTADAPATASKKGKVATEKVGT